jgi:hypothetical protein
MSSTPLTIEELKKQGAKKTYDRLKQERQVYVTRAVDCAKYTIPSLFPKEADDKNTKYETPWQSVGARGVNNLSSKLMLALFPPNASFFRLGVAEDVAMQYDPRQQAEVEQALMQLEDKIRRHMEANQIRVTISEALKQLIVTGNALLYLPPQENGIKLYKLHNFVVERDGLGNVISIITIDKMAKSTLPDDVASMVNSNKKPEDVVEIYTHIHRSGDQYISYQEVEGQPINGSDSQYPTTKSPYIPIRMTKVDGESYGRSFVEEYLGDLRSLESLSKAITLLAMISANIIILVNPNGVTRAKRLNDAKAGDFVVGRREDVQPLVLDKYADMQVARAQADTLESRLSYAFLLSSVVQRDAERVTAEEIRTVASELEDTLGGVYSILSQELQLPLVRRLFAQLMSTGEIPQLPEGTVEPTITTGLEALGRGHDLNRLNTFLSCVGQIPDALQYVNMQSMLIMIATSLGINTDGLIKTQEEIEAEVQQQQDLMAQEYATKGVVDNAAAVG